jgi:hypothetical protein
MTTAPYATLSQLSGFRVPVYASEDVQAHARALAQRFDRAYTYLTGLLQIPLDVRLALLSRQDWPRYVQSPFYGAAMYDYPQRTVVSGAEPTDFWEPILARLQADAPALLERLRPLYARADGAIDLTPHVELWMIHDLGHACHLHHAYWFPRKWLMELFAALCQYTYFAEREPGLLPLVETFLLVLHDLPAEAIEYRTLADFEARYIALPLDSYLWFAGHLMQLARDLYAQFGADAVTRMWRLFVLGTIEGATDAELRRQMLDADPGIAAILGALPEQYA